MERRGEMEPYMQGVSSDGAVDLRPAGGRRRTLRRRRTELWRRRQAGVGSPRRSKVGAVYEGEKSSRLGWFNSRPAR